MFLFRILKQQTLLAMITTIKVSQSLEKYMPTSEATRKNSLGVLNNAINQFYKPLSYYLIFEID